MADNWLKAAARHRPVRVTRVDPTVPNAARVWNYLLGGRDNFEADRVAARQLVESSPVLTEVVPASRAFLRRAVRFLAADAGIRQFLDLGTGIPTEGSTHEVAQSVAPQCRIVCVDNDPVVLTHARALLRSSPQGVTSYIDADIRDVATIVAGARQTLDFGEPVALVLISTLSFIEDSGEVAAILAALLDAVPAGSYLALAQPASDLDESILAAQRQWNEMALPTAWLRDRATVTAWFEGLELVEPGIVEVHRWRPAVGDPAADGVLPLYGAVARKP